MKPLQVWTIGHSNLTIDAFLALLTHYQIEAIADVRRFPGSRRYPHFNSEMFAQALSARDINYVHFPELGGRRRPEPHSINIAWRNESFRGYADYMATTEFRAGIDRLVALAAEKRTAVMCAEAVWWQCHRSMIADYLKVHEANVCHILSMTKVEEHPFTAPARIVNGSLTYAAPEQPELSI